MDEESDEVSEALRGFASLHWMGPSCRRLILAMEDGPNNCSLSLPCLERPEEVNRWITRPAGGFRERSRARGVSLCGRRMSPRDETPVIFRSLPSRALGGSQAPVSDYGCHPNQCPIPRLFGVHTVVHSTSARGKTGLSAVHTTTVIDRPARRRRSEHSAPVLLISHPGADHTHACVDVQRGMQPCSPLTVRSHCVG